MFKLLIFLSAIVAVTLAGSSGDVDEALLARVAQILSENEASGGGGSGGSLDGDLLARVSQIIAQSESSSGGGSSGGYNTPSDSYGPPSRGGSGSGGGLQIGRPERAQRIAEFSSSSGSSGGGSRNNGGYN